MGTNFVRIAGAPAKAITLVPFAYALPAGQKCDDGALMPDGRRHDDRMDMSVYTHGSASAEKRKNDDVV